METPHQKIERLLTAVESLTRDEESLFDHGQFVESTAVQQRSLPLVHEIAELLVGPDVARTLAPAVQIRLQSLLQNRKAHYERLSTKLEATQKELDRIAASQARAKKVRPAYSEASTVLPHHHSTAAFVG